MTLLARPLLPLVLLFLAACHGHATVATTTDAAPAVMNAKCPFSGNAANPDVSSDVAGKHVAFCCGGCKARFDALSPEKKAEIAAKAK